MNDKKEQAKEKTFSFADWEKMFGEQWGPLFSTWNDFFQVGGDNKLWSGQGR